jgi:alanyl-tRNA synthetase
LKEKAELLRQTAEILNVKEDKAIEAASQLFEKWKDLRKKVKK